MLDPAVGVTNGDTGRHWSQYRPLRDTTGPWCPSIHRAVGCFPPDATTQPIPHPPNGPAIKSVSPQFRERDAVGTVPKPCRSPARRHQSPHHSTPPGVNRGTKRVTDLFGAERLWLQRRHVHLLVALALPAEGAVGELASLVGHEVTALGKHQILQVQHLPGSQRLGTAKGTGQGLENNALLPFAPWHRRKSSASNWQTPLQHFRGLFLVSSRPCRFRHSFCTS